MKFTRIKQLKLFCFKNYTDACFSFEKSVIAICGTNGTGKTNLLDAIYHLCFSKSYFSGSMIMNYSTDQPGWRIDADIIWNSQEHNVFCSQPNQGKKTLAWDDVVYTRLSDHLGVMPAVFIAPDDIALINEGSENRRTFLDALISQTDPDYLQHLISYQHHLQQRNAHLKSGQVSHELLDVYDEKLIEAAQPIYLKRKEVISRLFPSIIHHYFILSGGKENINWEYKTALHESTMDFILRNNRLIDMNAQRTTEGIHRDDIIASLHQYPFKQTASQGQKKSLLFAMKMAAFIFIQTEKKIAPLLLLDDIFEKLDQERIKRLLDWVKDHSPSQVFLTDTHADRVKKSFEEIGINGQIIEL